MLYVSNLSQNVTFSLIVAEILGNSAVEDDGLADYEKKLLIIYFLIYRQLWGDFGLKHRQNRHKTGLNYNQRLVTKGINVSVRRSRLPASCFIKEVSVDSLDLIDLFYAHAYVEVNHIVA